MAGTGQHRHQPRNDGRVERNPLRVLAQKLFCDVHQVVHATSPLHCGNGGNNGHDDTDDVERDVFPSNGDTGETKGQHTEAAGHADTN